MKLLTVEWRMEMESRSVKWWGILGCNLTEWTSRAPGTGLGVSRDITSSVASVKLWQRYTYSRSLMNIYSHWTQSCKFIGGQIKGHLQSTYSRDKWYSFFFVIKKQVNTWEVGGWVSESFKSLIVCILLSCWKKWNWIFFKIKYSAEKN